MGLLPCLPVLQTPVSLPPSTPSPSASPAPRSIAGLEAPLSKNDYSLGSTVKLLFTLGSPCPYSCPALAKPVLQAELREGVENERRWLVSCDRSNKRTAHWGADNKRNPFSLSSRAQKSQNLGQAGPFPPAEPDRTCSMPPSWLLQVASSPWLAAASLWSLLHLQGPSPLCVCVSFSKDVNLDGSRACPPPE